MTGAACKDAHWGGIYGARTDVETSWFSPDSADSMAILDGLGLDPRASVIDVGGGTSRVVDALLARGHRDVTVLDLAAEALERSRARLGQKGGLVDWVVADITRWRPTRHHDLWHDRAVFHFPDLT